MKLNIVGGISADDPRNLGRLYRGTLYVARVCMDMDALSLSISLLPYPHRPPAAREGGARYTVAMVIRQAITLRSLPLLISITIDILFV